MSRLVLSRRVGEVFEIGNLAQVKILEVKDKDGNKVIRVRIKAHPSISISKKEAVKQEDGEVSDLEAESKSDRSKDISADK